MDKTQLEESHKVNPPIVAVGLYARMEDGYYDSKRCIDVSSGQFRPIDSCDAHLLKGISSDIDRGVWTLWTPTFSVKWSETLKPMTIEVMKHWMIREKKGDKEWVIVSISREKAKMCWRCVALELIGESMLR